MLLNYNTSGWTEASEREGGNKRGFVFKSVSCVVALKPRVSMSSVSHSVIFQKRHTKGSETVQTISAVRYKAFHVVSFFFFLKDIFEGP